MNNHSQTTHFRKRAPLGWMIGILFVLKVTAAGSTISDPAELTFAKSAGAGVQPGVEAAPEQPFDYGFTIKDLNGEKLDMKKLKGKVIFLNLWATWCGPCRVEMPSIQKLYDSVDKDKIAFVMLSLDQDRQTEKIRAYVAEKEFTFPVYQPASPLPKLLRVNMIPATFIIGPDGNVKTKRAGMANYDSDRMRQYLAGLADQK